MVNKNLVINMPRVFLSPQDAGILKDDGTILGACERSVGFRFSSIGSIQESTPLQEVGNAIHSHMTHKLRIKGNLLKHYGRDENVPVYGTLPDVNRPIFGYADTIVTGNILEYGIIVDNYMPCEIKSSGIKSDRKISILPWPRHIIQTTIYSMLLKTDEALLSYISREDGKEVWWKVDISTNDILVSKLYSTMEGLIYDPIEIPIGFSTTDIIDRYKYLCSCIENKQRIDEYKRDFYLYYPIDRVETLYQQRKITSSEKQKALTTGIIIRGDFECHSCQFRAECWKI